VLDTDFDALEVGQAFTTRGRTVTESDVASFASLTGDMHPQHTDAVWASESPFGERIAHGMLVLSYALGQLAFDPEYVMALRGVRDVVFKRPVRLGDTIHVRGKVAELDVVDDDAGLARVRVEVLNQEDKVVCRGHLDVLWRRGDRVVAARIDDAEPVLASIPF
jgi:3-hydroxybutyryl-CoA dehydratase